MWKINAIKWWKLINQQDEMRWIAFCLRRWEKKSERQFNVIYILNLRKESCTPMWWIITKIDAKMCKQSSAFTQFSVTFKVHAHKIERKDFRNFSLLFPTREHKKKFYFQANYHFYTIFIADELHIANFYRYVQFADDKLNFIDWLKFVCAFGTHF